MKKRIWGGSLLALLVIFVLGVGLGVFGANYLWRSFFDKRILSLALTLQATTLMEEGKYRDAMTPLLFASDTYSYWPIPSLLMAECLEKLEDYSGSVRMLRLADLGVAPKENQGDPAYKFFPIDILPSCSCYSEESVIERIRLLRERLRKLGKWDEQVLLFSLDDVPCPEGR